MSHKGVNYHLAKDQVVSLPCLCMKLVSLGNSQKNMVSTKKQLDMPQKARNGSIYDNTR